MLKSQKFYIYLDLRSVYYDLYIFHKQKHTAHILYVSVFREKEVSVDRAQYFSTSLYVEYRGRSPLENHESQYVDRLYRGGNL